MNKSKINKTRNALTVACTGLVKLMQSNMLNNKDGSNSVSVDYEFQADCLCQVGLGEKISQYEYRFDFSKLDSHIQTLLNQAKL